MADTNLQIVVTYHCAVCGFALETEDVVQIEKIVAVKLKPCAHLQAHVEYLERIKDMAESCVSTWKGENNSALEWCMRSLENEFRREVKHVQEEK